MKRKRIEDPDLPAVLQTLILSLTFDGPELLDEIGRAAENTNKPQRMTRKASQSIESNKQALEWAFSHTKTIKVNRPDLFAELTQCCVHGQRQTIVWLISHFNDTHNVISSHVERFVKIACENGYLNLARWLIDEFWITQQADLLPILPFLARSLLAHPYLDETRNFIEFLVERFHLSKAAIASAFFNLLPEMKIEGRVILFEWIVGRFEIALEDLKQSGSMVLALACEGGRVSMVKWLVRQFNFTVDDVRACQYRVIQVVLGNKRSKIANWLFKKFKLGLEDLANCIQSTQIFETDTLFNLLQKRFKMTGGTV